METNELIVNDEVIEISDEIATVDSGKGFMIAAGIGLAVLGGFAAYRYVIKPIVEKIKARTNRQAVNEDVFDSDDYEIEDLGEI